RKQCSKYGIVLSFFLMSLTALSQATNSPLPPLILLPVEIKTSTSVFYIDQSTKIIVAGNALNKIAGLLNTYITANGGKRLAVTNTLPSKNFISITIDSGEVSQPEGY